MCVYFQGFTPCRDHHGNPTTYKGTSGLLYDAESHLRQYGTFTAGYNGDGLRVWKQVGSAKTYYQYDGTDLVAEYNGSGTLAATNTIGANGLLSRSSNGQRQFYEFDPMGNVVRAEDVGSNTLGSWSYDAYGSRTGSAPTGPYLYGGQWGYYTDWDTSTNLILCTHRYYDPSLGRWLTRDPIGYSGGINLYGYVVGNPVNWMDPEGLAGKRPPRDPYHPDRSGPKVGKPLGCSPSDSIEVLAEKIADLNKMIATHTNLQRSGRSTVDHSQEIKDLTSAVNKCVEYMIKKQQHQENCERAKVVAERTCAVGATVGGGYLLYRGLRLLLSIPCPPTLVPNLERVMDFEPLRFTPAERENWLLAAITGISPACPKGCSKSLGAVPRSESAAKRPKVHNTL